MSRSFFLLVALLCLWRNECCASEITGQITIQPKLIPKTFVPAVYELRGMAVRDKPRLASQGGFAGKVAVWLEAPNTSGLPAVQSIMRQRDRHFEPALVIVPVGSTVEFPNLDPIFHNIFSLSATRSFDLGYYAEGKSRKVIFPQAGIVQVYCHIHPEMHGVVVVTSSRWTAQPLPDGTFSWSDVPAGKYLLVVWQKSAGLIKKHVTVPESGTVRINVDLPEETADN
jgi:plastocyanin